MTIRLRPSQRQQLERLASASDRTLTDVLRDALRLLVATEAVTVERDRVRPRQEPPR